MAIAPSSEREQFAGLRVLIPDGKHINDDILNLLVSKGLVDLRTRAELSGRTNNNLHVEISSEGLPFFSLTQIKNRRIPRFVATGQFDLAFTTTDRIADYSAEAIYSRKPLPTAIEPLVQYPNWFDPRLRLSLLVRDNEQDNRSYQQVKDLSGQPVVSTYVGQPMKLFREHKTALKLDTQIDGKEEGLVRSKTYEAAIVIVKSGEAMRAATLRELTVIMGGNGEIQPILVYNPESFKDKGKRQLLDRFLEQLQRTNLPVTNQSGISRVARWFGNKVATIATGARAAVGVTGLFFPH